MKTIFPSSPFHVCHILADANNEKKIVFSILTPITHSRVKLISSLLFSFLSLTQFWTYFLDECACSQSTAWSINQLPLIARERKAKKNKKL
jgi:hypothetical protein